MLLTRKLVIVVTIGSSHGMAFQEKARAHRFIGFSPFRTRLRVGSLSRLWKNNQSSGVHDFPTVRVNAFEQH
jgi:hypothetical protein